ncbi:unnamed protein product, partial [Staurois parvus]
HPSRLARLAGTESSWQDCGHRVVWRNSGHRVNMANSGHRVVWQDCVAPNHPGTTVASDSIGPRQRATGVIRHWIVWLDSEGIGSP